MNNTSINIRINSDTKAKAQELFNSLGMDMSTAINMFLNAAIEYKGIPFVIRKYSEDNDKNFADTQNIRISG